MQRFTRSCAKHNGDFPHSNRVSLPLRERRSRRRALGNACGDFLHFRVNVPIRGQKFTVTQLIRLAVELRHRPSCLANQQDARRSVPGMQTELPKALKPAAGDRREVKCRRAVAPHSMRPQREVPVVVNIRDSALRFMLGKPVPSRLVASFSIAETWIFLLIQVRAFTFGGCEQFPAHGLINDPGDKLSGFL